MNVGSSARIYVERDAELLKRVFDNLMVAVDDILGCDTLFFCFNGDRHPMLVGSTDHNHVLALKAQEAGVNVGGDVNTGEVTDVHRAVGVGESSSDKSAFKLIHILRITEKTLKNAKVRKIADSKAEKIRKIFAQNSRHIHLEMLRKFNVCDNG